MKQFVILSGKGGTGKTSLCAAFAHLGGSRRGSPATVLVDADVDAANLSLVLRPEKSTPHEFWGGSLAEISAEKCSGCAACVAVCRYDAILPDSEHKPAYRIDPIACDGCAACVYACPESAIRMVPQQEGLWFQSSTPFGALFHAELFPGRENSGKLVTQVKQQARLWSEDTNATLIVIDGPPGIGCPVISACAGTDLALLVTEPSVAGLHDLKRVFGTLQHFRIPAVICINKADVYPKGAKEIMNFATREKVEVIGEIPFDENIARAMLKGSPVTQLFPDSSASLAIHLVWEKSQEILFGRSG